VIARKIRKGSEIHNVRQYYEYLVAEIDNPSKKEIVPSVQIKGHLQIDINRGVVYFHSNTTGATVLRVSGLDIPENVSSIDVSANDEGTSYDTNDYRRSGNPEHVSE